MSIPSIAARDANPERKKRIQTAKYSKRPMDRTVRGLKMYVGKRDLGF